MHDSLIATQLARQSSETIDEVKQTNLYETVEIPGATQLIAASAERSLTTKQPISVGA